MSGYDAFRNNNEYGNGGSDAPDASQSAQNSYGPPQDNSNPYGPPQGNPSPYGPPQGNPNPYGAPQGNPYAAPHTSNNPYANNQPYGAGSPGGFSIMGLTWEKNIVPNPATNGMAPTNQKSVPVSYLLWFFLGWTGAHQFYLGNNSRGLFNLLLWLVTTILGVFLFVTPLIWTAYWIYEAVTLNDQTHEVNKGYIRKSIL